MTQTYHPTLVAKDIEAISIGSMAVTSSRAKMKAPIPTSPICCLAQRASPLHPSIVLGGPSDPGKEDLFRTAQADTNRA